MCRMWQLSGIPCIHLVAAYCHMNIDPVEGVDQFGYYANKDWSRGGKGGRVKGVEVWVKPVVVWVKAVMGEVREVMEEVREAVGEVKEVVAGVNRTLIQMMRNVSTINENVKTQESIVANMNDRGKIGFKLGDIEAEDNYKYMGVDIAEKEQTISSSADKGKAVAEPNVESTTELKATKKGSKRKATTASEELPLRINHKNIGRS
ncbi:chloramphenicol acetyltransferase-like domain-containing protein [Tanacetum coccineum]